ncbi:Glycoside Hydrolase Family 47 protein [Gigaspora rosea]|uniref:alpha-1,2-Mannosidase n=1 Tax=Gigaspora rosea TaxID=44941 RepID=A0A397UVQ8_9GLOM|nr:Glycoside Hydrolase Family 47 protein [Gigaspora rosea]
MRGGTTIRIWGLNTRFRLVILILFIFGILSYNLISISDFEYSDIIDYQSIWENSQQWFGDKFFSVSHDLGSQVHLDNVTQLPKIQYKFSKRETRDEKLLREFRRDSIKNGFLHAWNGYTKYAWGYDELLPTTNKGRNNFNGWGATIIDSLDTMWIMGLKEEFIRSRDFVQSVNFTQSKNYISVFETTIRYLGGLLSAYELSKDKIFLEKALELGNALLPSFNSPSGLPYNEWHLTRSESGSNYQAVLAQAGTLQLEFMKLSQLTGDSEFFFKVQNITNVLDNAKKDISGLYPLSLSHSTGTFTTSHISFGANGDSFYEYLLKEYIYVGGAIDQYRRMYIESIDSMHTHLVKDDIIKDRPDLLFLGELSSNQFMNEMDHLSCFVPGMLAMGSKILDRPNDLEAAIRLAETCYWTYNMTYTGIGPEKIWYSTSSSNGWNLPTGLVRIDSKYILRPETVESLFILYRVTGDKKYQDKAWEIWQAIDKWCKTPIAYSGLDNVNNENVAINNNMESFFLAETLKYLYLIFSPPDVISLDTYVFNTEAHPLLRMQRS